MCWGQVKWPDWLPKKYRKLWNWEGGTDEESDPADTPHEPNQTEPKTKFNWSDALAVEPTLEEPTLALSTSFLKEPVELEQYEDANENKAQHLTAVPTKGTELLDELIESLKTGDS